MRNSQGLNPNPLLPTSEEGYVVCNSTEAMYENFTNPEFKEFYEKHMPLAVTIFRDGDTDQLGFLFKTDQLERLRHVYRHFFGSSF